MFFCYLLQLHSKFIKLSRMIFNDILPHVPGLFPVRGLRPLWNRLAPAPVPMPVPSEPQPWVFVQHQPEQQHQQGPPPDVPMQPAMQPPMQSPMQLPMQPPMRPPMQPPMQPPMYPPPPSVQTLQPSAPAPEAEVLQCPVCKALLPPSVNRDEHVNSHFE